MSGWLIGCRGRSCVPPAGAQAQEVSESWHLRSSTCERCDGTCAGRGATKCQAAHACSSPPDSAGTLPSQAVALKVLADKACPLKQVAQAQSLHLPTQGFERAACGSMRVGRRSQACPITAITSVTGSSVARGPPR
eukprot:884111-Alexandrium_andersonii.AAC.1